MSTGSTLSTYLSEQKTRFLADNGDGWIVVMGNEAGDLDTFASSIGFAWLLSHILAGNVKAIALIPTSRGDFTLRAENIYALQLAGIKEGFHELLCPEDVPKPNLCTTFALVDHNSLQPTFALPGAKVAAIVDHHEDEGKHLDTAAPRIIEPTGSCASLVTRVIMSYPTLQIPPELAALLLSAIVIDTHGLKKGGKAVDADIEASGWLLPRTSVLASQSFVDQAAKKPKHVRDNPWIQSLTSTLDAKKSAISHLTTRDLLRRDYKEYYLNISPAICEHGSCSIKAGLATVPLPLLTFFSSSPAAAVVATQEWIKERGLSILGVLTHYKSKHGNSKRESMWVINEGVSGSKLPQVFFSGFEKNEILEAKRTNFERYGFGSQVGREKEVESDGEEELGHEATQTQTSPFSEGLVARVYKQKNTGATRKQVAPILKQLVEG